MNKSFIVILLSFLIITNLSADNKEKPICGNIQEPFLFWLWSSMSAPPNKNLVSNIKFIRASKFKTSDNKTLSGYVYISNNGKSYTPVKGYILVAMGNAMVSDQTVIALESFSKEGYDVYVYDYRGYAKSEGKRRINAIIEDYKEIAKTLNKKYDRKLLYGISLGGAIILNVIGSNVEYDAAVIDSSPSFLSTHGCPKRIDPVSNLPKDASKIFVITGEKDGILTKSMREPLRKAAHLRGAKTFNGEEYAHPFNDKDIKIHNQRMELILNHLTK